jgi:hypothetical protein
MKFARYTFAIAGIYGLLALIPQYFLLERFGTDNPPAVTHPAFYYGFLGVATAFQIVFLMIASDPRRYRPIMLASVVEKFSFAIATFVLFAGGNAALPLVAGASIDVLLGVLFIVSYAKSGRPADVISAGETAH